MIFWQLEFYSCTPAAHFTEQLQIIRYLQTGMEQVMATLLNMALPGMLRFGFTIYSFIYFYFYHLWLDRFQTTSLMCAFFFFG